MDELIDAYAYEMNVAAYSFELMGKLLDLEHVKNRIELYALSEVFIYGGAYLGIQFYNAANRFVKIPAIIDKKGKPRIDNLNIPTIDIPKFREIYKGQTVIIASIRYYREIHRELLDFVPEHQIMFLGEFLEGMIK